MERPVVHIEFLLSRKSVPATRYKHITVSYQDECLAGKTEKFSGFTAQIIQHEIDHCDGVLI